MSPSFSDYEADLLAAVEAWAMPAAVYADWLEERGDERAAGVRWLAGRRGRPNWVSFDEPRFVWENNDSRSPAALPRAVYARLRGDGSPGDPRHYESFATALSAAALAASETIAAGELESST